MASVLSTVCDRRPIPHIVDIVEEQLGEHRATGFVDGVDVVGAEAERAEARAKRRGVGLVPPRLPAVAERQNGRVVEDVGVVDRQHVWTTAKRREELRLFSMYWKSGGMMPLPGSLVLLYR